MDPTTTTPTPKPNQTKANVCNEYAFVLQDTAEQKGSFKTIGLEPCTRIGIDGVEARQRGRAGAWGWAPGARKRPHPLSHKTLIVTK